MGTSPQRSRLASVALGFFTLLLVATPLFAQPGDPFSIREGSGYHWLDEPDPDYQWFAPLDVDPLGERHRQAKTGWFFEIDRLYLNTSRPNSALQSSQGDFAWGNRIDCGYQTIDGWGIQLEVWDLDGPNITEVNNFQARNVHVTGLYRHEPFHNGAVLTTLLGMRFNNIKDRSQPQPFDDVLYENSILAGEVGFRLEKEFGRWGIMSQATGFLGHNWQQSDAALLRFNGPQSNTAAVPGGDFRIEARYRVTRDVSLMAGWNMVYYGDNISRAGFTEANIGGIDTLVPLGSQEDVVATGVVFGVTLNR